MGCFMQDFVFIIAECLLDLKVNAIQILNLQKNHEFDMCPINTQDIEYDMCV